MQFQSLGVTINLSVRKTFPEQLVAETNMKLFHFRLCSICNIS